MSHFSRIQTQIADKDFALMAIKDLGFSYEEGEQEVKAFGGQKTPVDIRIKLPLSYDIGLRKKGDTYEIIADWFGVRGINQKDFTQRLMQRYAYHAARAKLEQQGFNMVEEKVEETGQIRIVLRRMA
jgi:Protein of unknown function (DUF1257)